MTYDFKNKFSLLDTNILKEMIEETRRSEQFRPAFEFLKEQETVPFVLDATAFEFAGYSANKKDYDRRLSLIREFGPSSPVTSEDIEMATRLSAMYKCKSHSINPSQISYIDCLHAAQLVRFKERAFIVTTDVNDYPSFLFDTSKVIAIDEEAGRTIFVAFKTYNQEKMTKLVSRFDSSGAF